MLTSYDGKTLICCPPAAVFTNVVFDGIKSFGPYAFFGCRLTKLVIPASLETIDETAFCGFSGLTEFLNADYSRPGSSATNKKFVAKDGLLFEMRQDDAGNYTKYKSLLCFPDNKDTGSKLTYNLGGGGSLLNIAPYAFDDVKGLTTLYIGNCDGFGISISNISSDIHFYTATGGSTSVLKTIGAFAFNGYNNKFKTITIPEGVTEIGKYAFQGNNTLETINLPKTLVKFEWADERSPQDFRAYGNAYEEYLFRFGCRNLSRIVLRAGANYEASDHGLLYDKRTMELIHCPENYKYTTKKSYQYMNVKGLVVENEVKGIKSLGPYCFDNSLLEIVVLPTTLEKIGVGAFRHAAVKSLTIPAKVTSVGSFLLGGGSTTADNIDLFMMPLKAPTLAPINLNNNSATKTAFLGVYCNLYVKKTSFEKNYYGEEWTKDMKYYGYKIPIPITEKGRFFSICRDFDAEFGGTNLGAFIIKEYNKGNPNSVKGTSLDCYVPSRIGAKQDKYVGAIVQLYKVKGDKTYVEDGNWYRMGERDFSYKTQEKRADILGSEGEKNWLVGCPVPTYVNKVETKYALKYKKELGVSRFAQYISDGIVPMNKAYLDLTDHPYGGSSAAKELSLVFEEESETTGIEDSPIVDVDAQQNVARSPYYTLNGTKVDRPTAKGIYIHNGKKIVIR